MTVYNNGYSWRSAFSSGLPQGLTSAIKAIGKTAAVGTLFQKAVADSLQRKTEVDYLSGNSDVYRLTVSSDIYGAPYSYCEHIKGDLMHRCHLSDSITTPISGQWVTIATGCFQNSVQVARAVRNITNNVTDSCIGKEFAEKGQFIQSYENAGMWTMIAVGAGLACMGIGFGIHAAYKHYQKKNKESENLLTAQPNTVQDIDDQLESVELEPT